MIFCAFFLHARLAYHERHRIVKLARIRLLADIILHCCAFLSAASGEAENHQYQPAYDTSNYQHDTHTPEEETQREIGPLPDRCLTTADPPDQDDRVEYGTEDEGGDKSDQAHNTEEPRRKKVCGGVPARGPAAH